MKREVKLLALIVPIILLSSLVVAISTPAPMPGTSLPANPFQGISELLVGVLQTVGDVFKYAFGESPLGLGEDVFARAILFIIVISVLYWPASKLTKGNKTLSILVSGGVALLGVRFIDANTLNAVLLPYSAVTLAISVIVPIALYGIFIYNEDIPAPIRKAGWWILAFCYLALWIWRSPSLAVAAAQSSSSAAAAQTSLFAAPLPAGTPPSDIWYLGGFVLCIVLGFLDRQIDATIEKLKRENATLKENFTEMTAENAKLNSDYKALLEEKNRMIASGTATAASLQDMENRLGNLQIAIQGMNKSMAAIGKRLPSIKPTRTRR